MKIYDFWPAFRQDMSISNAYPNQNEIIMAVYSILNNKKYHSSSSDDSPFIIGTPFDK
jgi:hypothetical protein